MLESNVAEPASKREISNRSDSNDSKRSTWWYSNSVDLWKEGSISSRPPYSSSAAILTVVRGVRSSWETSETNLCCILDSVSS